MGPDIHRPRSQRAKMHPGEQQSCSCRKARFLCALASSAFQKGSIPGRGHKTRIAGAQESSRAPSGRLNTPSVCSSSRTTPACGFRFLCLCCLFVMLSAVKMKLQFKTERISFVPHLVQQPGMDRKLRSTCCAMPPFPHSLITNCKNGSATSLAGEVLVVVFARTSSQRKSVLFYPVARIQGRASRDEPGWSREPSVLEDSPHKGGFICLQSSVICYCERIGLSRLWHGLPRNCLQK